MLLESIITFICVVRLHLPIFENNATNSFIIFIYLLRFAKYTVYITLFNDNKK